MAEKFVIDRQKVERIVRYVNLVSYLSPEDATDAQELLVHLDNLEESPSHRWDRRGTSSPLVTPAARV